MNISENPTGTTMQQAHSLSEKVSYTHEALENSNELELRAQKLIARCHQLLSQIQDKLNSINQQA